MATDKQIDNRKNHLGASDISSILGLNPFKSAYDVYLEKTEKVEPQEDNPVMKLGRELEQVVLNMAEQNLGKLVRNQYRSAKADGLPIGSLCDAILVEDGITPVEGKTTKIINSFAKEHWGEDGTDEVPDRIIIQAETQMICTGADICYVPALIGGRGYCMFVVKKDNDIMAVIAEKAIAFWNNNVLRDCPPENTYPSVNFLKKMKREPNKTIDIPDELVQNWLITKENLKSSEKIKEETEIKLKTSLGTAEAGNCSQGLITYYTQQRKPKLCPQCGTVVYEGSQFPVLRFKPAKKELTEGVK